MTYNDVNQIIQILGLVPLPVEGGLYKQTYRSTEEIPAAGLPERYRGTGDAQKPLGTAILYLLTNEPAGGDLPAGDLAAFSAFHRLKTDEIFHFYLGDPLEMTLLFLDGSSRQVILGQDVLNGQQVQFVAPRSVWQGTRLLMGGRFALIGTTMAPGFTNEDYEQGDRAALLAQYPHERERILALTR
ncbi:MAG: cupin domain-containing protein [Chloroflexi bacterium]|nr:MAG: cupin domain-containing protein [Chloroflexota bacterium]